MKTDKEFRSYVLLKIKFFTELINNSIVHSNNMINYDILGISEQMFISKTCEKIKCDIKKLEPAIDINNEECQNDFVITILQNINNDFSSMFKKFGTHKLSNLIEICFGLIDNELKKIPIDKYNLLENYFHPTSYSVYDYKDVKNKKKKMIIPFYDTLQTGDIFQIYETRKHNLEIFGFYLVIYNSTIGKILIVTGVCDNIDLNVLINPYVEEKINLLVNNLHAMSNNESLDSMQRFTKSLTIKDICSSNVEELINKYYGLMTHSKVLKQKGLQNVIKDFLSFSISEKRNLLISLLIDNEMESKYLSYLLYDLISNNDNNGNIDNAQQLKVFNTFPNTIKELFLESMKNTLDYSNTLNDYDKNKIPYEQQICIMQTNDDVKEKAMNKLKELKNKSEDSGNKARNYLDGLLKIPFSIVRKERVLQLMGKLKSNVSRIKSLNKSCTFNNNNNIYSVINDLFDHYFDDSYFNTLNNYFNDNSKNELSQLCLIIKEFLSSYYPNINLEDNTNTKKTKNNFKKYIENFIKNNEVDNYEKVKLLKQNNILKCNSIYEIILESYSIKLELKNYINNIDNILNLFVHGHDQAKQQVKRVLGQWINGNNSKGYCLGFEGPPGVGKTTLAKEGLTMLLKDIDGTNRPFSMIQLGGDSNGSSLHGHNYTYVGSTWGSIVQILMDKKCMNPIILIDEVDKISKTEHGREIVGILTHILDPTQNDCFQDKYFSGVDIDLSKVLFILSYNNASEIDSILLDRVHRIHFSSLSLEEKIHISRTYVLPELYKKFGIESSIIFSDETLELLITNYTCEPGIRKLKEIFYVIIGEITLQYLKEDNTVDITEEIKYDDIVNHYIPDKIPIIHQKIHEDDTVGMVNCLYATTSGHSGILAATSKFIYSDKKFDLKLTGLLDDMMRESFAISFTLAFNLLDLDRKEELTKIYETTKCTGIHMHMGDGSINKSGTSAGIAISVLMYSILSNKKIKHDFAITGEAADLRGKVGEIGALKYKFIGGIRAGVKNFIFPENNIHDYNMFMKKYKDNKLIEGISFYPVKDLNQVIELIIVK